jgi:sugar O-acyltransferase (sialic acid O-acetyltransferase NeuD family)
MKLVLLGGGGHCISCVEVLRSSGIAIEGVVDPRGAPEGLKGLGDDRWLNTPEAKQARFLVTVGQVGVSAKRRELFEAVRSKGLPLATVRAHTAVIAASAFVGEGSIVMHGAVVNADARIGLNCIVNTGAIVEHGAVVADHCHVAPGAILSGEVRIGEGSMIGTGAVVLQGVNVGPGVMVGAGAVVTRSITESGTWAGVPARRIA